MTWKRIHRALKPYYIFAVLLALWYIASRMEIWNTYLLPPPWKVGATFRTMLERGEITASILVSLRRVLTGLSISFVLAFLLGVVTAYWPSRSEYLRHITNFMRNVPPLSLISLLILWFGIGEKYKYFLIFIAAFVPFTLNAFAGASHVDKQLVGAARMLGASKSQLFFEIVVPAAVPSIFSGAQVALSNSWMTMLAAEMVCATEGVGWIIIAGQSVNDMTQMIAGMLAIGIVGLLLAIGMRKLEERCLIWNNQGK